MLKPATDNSDTYLRRKVGNMCGDKIVALAAKLTVALESVLIDEQYLSTNRDDLEALVARANRELNGCLQSEPPPTIPCNTVPWDD